MPTRLIELLDHLPGQKVVLLGDLMVDRYLYGNAERLSPEAPVPVLHYQHEEIRLGGCGNVAADLATLGCEVRLIGVVGNDEGGTQVRGLLLDWKIDDSHIVIDPARPTTRKLRLVGSAQHRHPQQLLRLDYEQTAPITGEVARQVIEQTLAALEGAAVLAIEDYNKGALPPEVLSQVLQAARERGIPAIVDPASIKDISRYAGASALKLNRLEGAKASGLPIEHEFEYEPAAVQLLDKLDLDAVILTLDKHGAFLATRDGERRRLTTRSRQVFDVTGAGDMVLAMTAAARAAGGSWAEAVALANIAGGLEVERFGAVPIKPDEILQELLTEAHEHLGKERTLEQLLPELARHRASGKRIVFTNGCFDIIHLGHVEYFRFARRQGDLLVVGVNTDDGIRRLKGPTRPIIAEADRVGVLTELESIDYLVRFDEPTPIDLIRRILPDVLVKGADYAKEQVVGWDVVEKAGGTVALAPMVDGRSTSAVIRRIVESHQS